MQKGWSFSCTLLYIGCGETQLTQLTGVHPDFREQMSNTVLDSRRTGLAVILSSPTARWRAAHWGKKCRPIPSG